MIQYHEISLCLSFRHLKEHPNESNHEEEAVKESDNKVILSDGDDALRDENTIVSSSETHKIAHDTLSTTPPGSPLDKSVSPQPCIEAKT